MKVSSVLLILMMACSLCARPNPSPGCFGAAGEYLYFFNGSDQAYFATEVATPAAGESIAIPNNSRYANEQEWHSGYRAELIYGFYSIPSQLQVRGTWIPQFSESRTVTKPFLFPAQGQGIIDEALNGSSSPQTFTSISVNNTFSFYAVDAFYSHSIYRSPCFKLDLKEGVEYSNIGFTEHQTLVIPPNITHKWNSRSQNIGPAIALATHLNLWRNLSLEVTGTGSILASRKSASLSFVNPTLATTPFLVSASTSLFDDHRWFVIPAYDLRAGLQYMFQICHFCLNVEIGYEFLSYFRGLERISLNDGPNFGQPGDITVSSGLSRNDYFNFAMHGLYAQLGVSF